MQPAIGFCATKKHAHNLCKYFNDQGCPSAVILDKTPANERARILSDLRVGKIKVIFSVDVVSEGFDEPCLTVALCARPTKSLTIHIQQIGRVLRVYPGKEYAVIIDQADNIASLRHNPFDRLDLRVIWAEDTKVPQKKLAGEVEESPKESHEKVRKARREALLEFATWAMPYEARIINRLFGTQVRSKRKPAWVFFEFVKTCFLPSLASFEVIGEKLGYAKGWAKYAHAKATAYYKLIAGDNDWANKLPSTDKEQVLSWVEEPKKEVAAVPDNTININPHHDNYFPQMKQALSRGGMQEVRRVYRQLAIALHPDRNPDMPIVKMQNLNEAYESMSAKYEG